MKRVIVVSKSELYFRILEPYLREKGIDICAICNLPVNILETYLRYNADIIILDANWHKLPVTGLEILQHLLAINPSLKIITVTNSPESESLYRMQESGAMGYFYRTTNDLTTIVKCINAVSKGQKYFINAL